LSPIKNYLGPNRGTQNVSVKPIGPKHNPTALIAIWMNLHHIKLKVINQGQIIILFFWLAFAEQNPVLSEVLFLSD
jgi:hypothetical protein